MDLDSGIPLTELLVDGGMTVNEFLMQLQANVLGINVGKFQQRVYLYWEPGNFNLERNINNPLLTYFLVDTYCKFLN